MGGAPQICRGLPGHQTSRDVTSLYGSHKYEEYKEYEGRVATIHVLKQRIGAEFSLITEETRAAAFEACETSLGLRTWRLGGHAEALYLSEEEP